MLERAKKLFKVKKPLSLESKREIFKKEFFSNPYHNWILKDKYLTSSFETLFDHFNQNALDFFTHKNGNTIIFAPSNGKLSCTLNQLNKGHVILVFNDLERLLRSTRPENGIAVLAHELGHLYYQHSQRQISKLDAQVEADYFAYQLGLGHALQDVLIDHQESVDCKVRISKLTSLLMTNAA